jgi:hypothetical protein
MTAGASGDVGSSADAAVVDVPFIDLELFEARL